MHHAQLRPSARTWTPASRHATRPGRPPHASPATGALPSPASRVVGPTSSSARRRQLQPAACAGAPSRPLSCRAGSAAGGPRCPAGGRCEQLWRFEWRLPGGGGARLYPLQHTVRERQACGCTARSLCQGGRPTARVVAVCSQACGSDGGGQRPSSPSALCVSVLVTAHARGQLPRDTPLWMRLCGVDCTHLSHGVGFQMIMLLVALLQCCFEAPAFLNNPRQRHHRPHPPPSLRLAPNFESFKDFS